MAARTPRLPSTTAAGLSSALVLLLPLVVFFLAAPIEGRQPGDSFRPNTLQNPPASPSFQSTLQNALNSLAIPAASSFSATLAATTRFFASFSSTSTTSTDCEYPTPSWRCWEPICSGRVDGLYPDWSTNCRRSVRCQGGRVTAAIGCPSGQLSTGRGGCRPAHEVSCPRVSEGSAPVHLAPHQPAAAPVEPAPAHPLCWGRSPSLTQDRSPSSRCRQYFRCTASGQRSVETCPGTQVFDGTRCLDSEYYTCSVGADSDSASSPCDRLSDGPHPQPGSRCRAYFRCSLGFKSVFVCSGDSVFDGERCVPGGLCAEDSGVGSSLSSQQQQQPQRRPQSQDGVCAGKSHGYFADVASGCRGYVYCLSGAPVGTFRCEGGRRFDGRVCADSDFCNGFPVASNFASSSTSSFQQQQQQQAVKQGFFADLQSGCRSYSFFIAGHETKLSCPAGLLFNGQLCVSENTYTCPPG
ncbi:uncharacterized protein LOC117639698 [Thrips palmi]|uniref:Uncharacterized protein LOC117639698 n=1 Tax=Thrips palmi TaxID=161013 RepID=A0A6P8Y4U5_THRPL|nr:uncharacterized protein LOC117639698 [Thrips palmi]